FRKFLAHNRLGAAVGGGHKIARALQRNLELFNLAEVALEATAGAMRRLDHDIKDRGGKHAACRKPLSGQVKLTSFRRFAVPPARAPAMAWPNLCVAGTTAR